MPLTNPTVVPTQQENQDVLATYKPYSCSHAIENKYFSNPALAPTQHENDDFPATYKPYSCSHAREKQRFSCDLQTLQLFPADGSDSLTIITFANPVEFSSVVKSEGYT